MMMHGTMNVNLVMFFDHHTPFNAIIIFRANVTLWRILFSVSSVFGKYGSQVPKFGTTSNDVTVVRL
jgi:hypothetical protein